MKYTMVNDMQYTINREASYRDLRKMGQYIFAGLCFAMLSFLIILVYYHFHYQKPYIIYTSQFLQDSSYYLYNMMNNINDTSPMYFMDDLLWAINIFLIHALSFIFFFDNGVACEGSSKRFRHRPYMQNRPFLCVVLIAGQCVLSYFLIHNYYALLKILFTFTISVPMAFCLLLSIYYCICGRAWYGLLYHLMKDC